MKALKLWRRNRLSRSEGDFIEAEHDVAGMSHCEVELSSSLSDGNLLSQSKTTAIDDFGHHLWGNISGDVNVVSHGRNPGTEKFDQFVGSRHVFISVDTDELTKKIQV